MKGKELVQVLICMAMMRYAAGNNLLRFVVEELLRVGGGGILEGKPTFR